MSVLVNTEVMLLLIYTWEYSQVTPPRHLCYTEMKTIRNPRVLFKNKIVWKLHKTPRSCLLYTNNIPRMCQKKIIPLSWIVILKQKLFFSTKYWLCCGTLKLDQQKGVHGRDRMVIGFTTTYAICAYHH
jgi:hypothetical protein